VDKSIGISPVLALNWPATVVELISIASMRNSTTYFTALSLFDTGTYTPFVNREVEKSLEQQQQHGVRLHERTMPSLADMTSLRLRLA
jgi:hypothetical protein